METCTVPQGVGFRGKVHGSAFYIYAEYGLVQIVPTAALRIRITANNFKRKVCGILWTSNRAYT